MSVSLICETKKLKDEIRAMRIGLKNNFDLKLNILPGEIEFILPGISRIFPAETEGKATIILPGAMLAMILKTHTASQLKLEFKDGKLICGTFSTTGIKILDYGEHQARQPIPIPINFSERDILRLTISHSLEYLRSNNLLGKIESVRLKKQEDIEKAWALLAKYGVNHKELQGLVDKSVFGALE